MSKLHTNTMILFIQGLEHLQRLLSKGDTKGCLDTSHPGLLPASAHVRRAMLMWVRVGSSLTQVSSTARWKGSKGEGSCKDRYMCPCSTR